MLHLMVSQKKWDTNEHIPESIPEDYQAMMESFAMFIRNFGKSSEFLKKKVRTCGRSLRQKNGTLITLKIRKSWIDPYPPTQMVNVLNAVDLVTYNLSVPIPWRSRKSSLTMSLIVMKKRIRVEAILVMIQFLLL